MLCSHICPFVTQCSREGALGARSLCLTPAVYDTAVCVLHVTTTVICCTHRQPAPQHTQGAAESAPILHPRATFSQTTHQVYVANRWIRGYQGLLPGNTIRASASAALLGDTATRRDCCDMQGDEVTSVAVSPSHTWCICLRR